MRCRPRVMLALLLQDPSTAIYMQSGSLTVMEMMSGSWFQCVLDKSRHKWRSKSWGLNAARSNSSVLFTQPSWFCGAGLACRTSPSAQSLWAEKFVGGMSFEVWWDFSTVQIWSRRENGTPIDSVISRNVGLRPAFFSFFPGPAVWQHWIESEL